MSEEYTPFGDEWKKEMKKFNKDKLVDMFRSRCMELADLKKSAIDSNLCLCPLHFGDCELCEDGKCNSEDI